MEWTDIGIVLGTRRHGEANAILEVMTPDHGRHLGLVRGGAGSRLRPVLQPGNSVNAVWRARLDEHLGHFAVEGHSLRAASFLSSAHAVYGITHLAALCRVLPERDPHPAVFEALAATIERLDDAPVAAVLIARFELKILAELGFGLDLSECAANGGSTDLIYVSPKSGRAVSREAGEPWRDKLLRLPAFLRETEEDRSVDADAVTSLDDVAAGFQLTGFFLARHVFEPRGVGLPDAREHFIAAVTRRHVAHV